LDEKDVIGGALDVHGYASVHAIDADSFGKAQWDP